MTWPFSDDLVVLLFGLPDCTYYCLDYLTVLLFDCLINSNKEISVVMQKGVIEYYYMTQLPLICNYITIILVCRYYGYSWTGEHGVVILFSNDTLLCAKGKMNNITSCDRKVISCAMVMSTDENYYYY